MTRQSRIERDTMGEVAVPVDALYGAQTQRAVENFPISGRGLERSQIRALGLVKAACARVNAKLGVLDPTLAEAVAAAADEVGDRADQQPHHHHLEELHEANEAEIEDADGQFVDLPADRDRLHLVGAVGRRTRAPVGHV